MIFYSIKFSSASVQPALAGGRDGFLTHFSLAGNALLRVKCPTLLIVGERDDEVVELNEEAYGMLDGEKDLRLVRGATHSFEEPGALEEVARLTAEWFLEHLHLTSGARFRH